MRISIQWLAVAALGACLVGCDAGKTIGEAEDDVRAQLRDPSSAIFSEEVRHPPKDNQSAVICGKVNSRNGFGGMSGPRRFISGGMTLVKPDGDGGTAQEVFDASWKDFCSSAS